MTTKQIILDTITFKGLLDNALQASYIGAAYMRTADIFGQEVRIYTRDSEVAVMSDQKDPIWTANNHIGSQANLVEWLMSNEDDKK
jgi:hypothetical protein